MEAGYDYTLLHPSIRRRRHNKALGVFFIVLGVTLLVMTGAYYTYGATVHADPVGPDGKNAEASASAEQSLTKDHGGSPAEAPPDALRAEMVSSPPVSQPEVEKANGAGLAASSDAATDQGAPAFWTDTPSYEAASPETKALVESFTPIEANQGFPLDSRLAATRISVPSVGIDVKVTELESEELEGARAYQTPDKTAGHIPETANAGEAGGAWFFGHTEAPTMGEGSVFFSLKEIPELIGEDEGRDVFAIAESEEGQYLYRLNSFQVVHGDDIRLDNSEGATIHLVSCVPKLVYDNRLIVSGELIGYKELNGDT